MAVLVAKNPGGMVRMRRKGRSQVLVLPVEGGSLENRMPIIKIDPQTVGIWGQQLPKSNEEQNVQYMHEKE